MAQRVLLVCDLHDDDRTGAETVIFGLDGTSYEIDLCEEHSEELHDAFAPFVGAARRAGSGPAASGGGGRRARAVARPPASDRQRTQEIREWARAQGYQVSDRGRIPTTILEQYESTH